MAPKATVQAEPVTVKPLNLLRLELDIEGLAPYVQARFSEKARAQMRTKQEAGSTSRKGTAREARDFDRDFEQAQHRSTDGWVGIPAAALRNACIDACRLVGFQMTRAKMSIFIEADGFDALDGTPLIRLGGGDPERVELAVRNANGVADLRVRPMWRTWTALVRVTFDGDQFTTEDVVNLLVRAGRQVGIGEGRPFSKSSNGMGWGMFSVKGEAA